MMLNILLIMYFLESIACATPQEVTLERSENKTISTSAQRDTSANKQRYGLLRENGKKHIYKSSKPRSTSL